MSKQKNNNPFDILCVCVIFKHDTRPPAATRVFTLICGIVILVSGFLSSIFNNKSLRSSDMSALL